MSAPAIRVENVSKVYRIGQRLDATRTMAGALTGFVTSPLRNLRRLRALARFRGDEDEMAGEVVWALRDVSFTVDRGEVLGVIGRNGAGKSTLLKVLARITAPTTGRVTLDGRISSLLEVGTGFHPELTGRENVYLNGSILGMSRSEIDAKLDEIVDFSGVEKFIETPVKYYSSGMRVRLAFSVAAHLEPEILLVDEVLAVGDIEFQRKCIGKMGEVSRAGRTVLFVSHSMTAVASLCDRGIWIEGGTIRSEGPIDAIISAYLSAAETETEVDISGRSDRIGDGKVRFTDLTVTGSAARGTPGQVLSGAPAEISLYFEKPAPIAIAKAEFTVVVNDAYQNPLFACATHLHGNITGLPSEGCVRFKIDRFPLSAGEYKLRVHCAVNDEVSDLIEEAGRLTVYSGDFYGSGRLPRADRHGVFLVDYDWSVEALNGESGA
ncbi:MAG TPA: ABC transporter ATP-binding protein [Anaerolineales bacterium]|nr:ABC transporter ATP-binding protein [Anaerolineales bacterium]